MSQETPRKINVMLVDDHPAVLQGIRGYLVCEPDLAVCAETGRPEEVLPLALKSRPDIVVMDIGVGEADGLDLTRSLLIALPQLRVVVFTMHEEVLYAEDAVASGARGFISKKQEPAELVAAIRKVAAGELVFSPGVQQHLLGKLLAQGNPSAQRARSAISRRERDILRLLSRGLSTAKIADTLGIAKKTVAAHRAHIMEKLNIPDTASLMRFAFEWMGRSGGRGKE